MPKGLQHLEEINYRLHGDNMLAVAELRCEEEENFKQKISIVFLYLNMKGLFLNVSLTPTNKSFKDFSKPNQVPLYVHSTRIPTLPQL